ncbi:MAG TPA: right-handed parallel beta-helix repeat-containing protein, partial [Bdellovibrionota bacterium]
MKGSHLPLNGLKWVSVPAAISGPVANNIPTTLTFSVQGGENVDCAFTDTANTGQYKPTNCKAGEFYLTDSLTLNGACPVGSTCPTVDNVFNNPPDACGATLNASAHLLGDLNCPNAEIGLRLAGSIVNLEGRGHKIIAPAASTGLFVQGTASIDNVNVSGVTKGAGLMAYNPESLVVSKSTFSGNQIGIQIYSESKEAVQLSIEENTITGNSEFGVRMTGEEGFLASYPRFVENNLSNNKGYA